MMRKGLQITLGLAIFVQATMFSLSAQQQAPNRQATSQIRPANPMGRSNDFPPMVRPDQFGRRQAVAEQPPRRVTGAQQSRFQAGQLHDSRSQNPNAPRTITFTDQRANSGYVRQVSYTQDGVPVPSILGNQAKAPPIQTPATQTPVTRQTPVGQFPGVNSGTVDTPKVASVPAEMQPPQQTAVQQTAVQRSMNQQSADQQATPQIQPPVSLQVPPTRTIVGQASQTQTAGHEIVPPTSNNSQLQNGGSFDNPIRSSVQQDGLQHGLQHSGGHQDGLRGAGMQREGMQQGTGHQQHSTALLRTPKAVIQDSPIDETEQPSTPQQTPDRSMTERMASNFRTVDYSNERGSQIRTEGPKLEVSANGPSSIGIGKPARYEVVVHNKDRTTANNLIVGVDLPGWIEIKNINTTQGTREVTDGSQESRLIWNVKQIAAGTTEKLIIDVVPRESKMFDLNVEWTVMPIRGTVSVQVTEPRLDIEISGPNEIQFGDNVLYSVTVSNPGTGVAENVSVILPEALGGERASLGSIQAGRKKEIQVELIARQSGSIELATTATADGELRQTDSRNVIVRRGELDVQVSGPQMKYAGSVATYQVVVTNIGDAIAQDVVAAVALPAGVEYLSGVEAVEKVQGGLRWNVGTLPPGNERTFHVNCQLNRAGEMSLEVASRAKGDLATTGTIRTTVEAVADLVLTVQDPKGPLPTGQDVVYQIKIKNRGSKVARQVELVMQFSDGIEPVTAHGQRHELVAGQVLFSPIEQIDPGQEITLKVSANATLEGKHIYRAQLTCEESETREISEGTTKFYTGNGNSSQLRTGRTEDFSNGGTFRK